MRVTRMSATLKVAAAHDLDFDIGEYLIGSVDDFIRLVVRRGDDDVTRDRGVVHEFAILHDCNFPGKLVGVKCWIIRYTESVSPWHPIISVLVRIVQVIPANRA